MKKKRPLALIAMLAAGSMLLLSGCNVDVTTINEEEISLEAELENSILAEGMIMLHTVWYYPSGNKLANADISFYDGDMLVYSGTTNDEGSLPTCALPCNTEIYCSIIDNSGGMDAEAEIVIKLSDNYSELSVYPTKDAASEDGLAQSVIEAPTTKTNIRAAIFLTETGGLSFANLTPYVEPEAEPEDPASASETTVEEIVVTDDVLDAIESTESVEESDEVTAYEIEEAVEAEESIENGEGETVYEGEESYEGGE